MTRELRGGKLQNGLILANGGVLTHQHALCLSAHSRKDGRTYPVGPPLPEHVTDSATPPFDEQADGPAYIEVIFVSS